VTHIAGPQMSSKTKEGSTAVAFPPPLAFAKAFSRSDRGSIFPLFSRVMRKGLSTGLPAMRSESDFSWPIFSGPAACVNMVGLVAVWCRSFDSVMCSKGDELWAQSGRMNFARMRCGSR